MNINLIFNIEDLLPHRDTFEPSTLTFNVSVDEVINDLSNDMNINLIFNIKNLLPYRDIFNDMTCSKVSTNTFEGKVEGSKVS